MIKNSINLKGIAFTHLTHVKMGGWPVLFHKAKRLAGTILWPVFWVLAYPLIVLARPVIWIRLGTILATRIGHFGYDLAFYLAERELRGQPSRGLDLFHLRGVQANKYLGKLCHRYLNVVPGIAQGIGILGALPGGQRHLIEIKASHRYAYRDIDGVLDRTSRSVFLKKEEEDRGWLELLERWGVERNTPIVCVQVRSNAYLDQLMTESPAASEFRNRNSHKNADVTSFEPAMNALAEQGYTCFRMGAVRDVPLTLSHPRVIDYANEGRSEFLDLFLASSCRFFVSTGSGIDCLADLFRKPIVFCDQATVEATNAWGPHLTIFKHQLDTSTGRKLTFDEIIDSGLGAEFDARGYARRGIQLIDNSAEEIKAVIFEMVARLDGTHKDQPNDQDRQDRFWALLAKSKYQGYRKGRVGSSFLRENQELLT